MPHSCSWNCYSQVGSNRFFILSNVSLSVAFFWMKFSFLCPIERKNTPWILFLPSLDSSTVSHTRYFSCRWCVCGFWFDLNICSSVLGFSAVDLIPFLSLAVYLPLCSGCMRDLSSKTKKYFPSFWWTFVTTSESHMLLSYPFYISLSWSIKVLHLKGFCIVCLSYFVYVRVPGIHLPA